MRHDELCNLFLKFSARQANFAVCSSSSSSLVEVAAAIEVNYYKYVVVCNSLVVNRLNCHVIIVIYIIISSI